MNQIIATQRGAQQSDVHAEEKMGLSALLSGGLWVLGWVVVCVAGIAGYVHINTATTFFLAASCVGAAMLGHWHARTIVAHARVLGAKVVPVQLWRESWAQSLAGTARLWLVMVLAVATVLLPAAPTWHVLTFVATASAVQAASTLVGLAARGLLQRIWLWVPALLSLVVLAGSALGVGVVTTVQGLDAIPAVVRGAMALSWPVLMVALSQAWCTVPVVMHPAKGLHLVELIWAFRRRYVFLRVGGTWGSTFTIFYIAFFSGNSIKPDQISWGGAVTSYNLVFQLILIIAASWLLTYRDLHWRALLVPGYVRVGGIGTRIVRSSLEVWAGFLLAMAALTFGLQWLDSGFNWSSVVEATKAYAFLPLQLLCAVSIAALIRGSKPALHWESKALGFAFALWLTLFVLRLTGVHLPSVAWFEAGYSYALALLLISAASLWRANRVWTVDRLARFAPDRQPATPSN